MLFLVRFLLQACAAAHQIVQMAVQLVTLAFVADLQMQFVAVPATMSLTFVADRQARLQVVMLVMVLAYAAGHHCSVMQCTCMPIATCP